MEDLSPLRKSAFGSPRSDSDTTRSSSTSSQHTSSPTPSFVNLRQSEGYADLLVRQAHSARECRDWAAAFPLYASAAIEGNAVAQGWASYCYIMGFGTKKEPELAYSYASRSALAYDPLGINNLAFCFENALGCRRNIHLAAQLYERSAASGFPRAQSNLGRCYAQGLGVELDEVKAAALYTKAAAGGDADAFNNLGSCYFYGRGVERDFERAFYLFGQSAAQGSREGKFNVAMCMLTGRGADGGADRAVATLWEAKTGGQDGEGFAPAIYRLGCCVRDGIGCHADANAALMYFKAAAAKGYAKANVALLALLTDEDRYSNHQPASIIANDELTPTPSLTLQDLLLPVSHRSQEAARFSSTSIASPLKAQIHNVNFSKIATLNSPSIYSRQLQDIHACGNSSSSLNADSSPAFIDFYDSPRNHEEDTESTILSPRTVTFGTVSLCQYFQDDLENSIAINFVVDKDLRDPIDIVQSEAQDEFHAF